ncbi:MAG: hypothetical protein HQ502_11835 [Alphaproteobacteria bacterium]|nr:hypothetical protein [Alphaproteobacteria bacterium]
MKDKYEAVIWTVVVLGTMFYMGTFVVVWNATEDYRENIARPQISQSETIRNSLYK